MYCNSKHCIMRYNGMDTIELFNFDLIMHVTFLGLNF